MGDSADEWLGVLGMKAQSCALSLIMPLPKSMSLSIQAVSSLFSFSVASGPNSGPVSMCALKIRLSPDEVVFVFVNDLNESIVGWILLHCFLPATRAMASASAGATERAARHVL